MQQPAQSLYRQVRITITEERGGRVSCRVMVKGVSDSWTLRHTVWHHNWRVTTVTSHWMTLVRAALAQILEEELPGLD